MNEYFSKFRNELAAKHPELQAVFQTPEPTLEQQATLQEFSTQLFLARAKQREQEVLKTPPRE